MHVFLQKQWKGFSMNCSGMSYQRVIRYNEISSFELHEYFCAEVTELRRIVMHAHLSLNTGLVFERLYSSIFQMPKFYRKETERERERYWNAGTHIPPYMASNPETLRSKCLRSWNPQISHPFLVNDQRDAQILFYVFISIYNSLHVSSTSLGHISATNIDCYQRLYWYNLSLLMISTVCPKHVESYK